MNTKNTKPGINLAIVTLATLAAGSILHNPHAVARAQASRSTADGVYTAEQAKRGEKLYAEQCTFCHGDDLLGTDGFPYSPPLTGPGFEFVWRGKPVSDLFENIRSTMPQTAPGSLTPEQSADVVAYLFSVMKSPAGSMELVPKVEELKQISIAQP